jgi:hypothetical protein
MKPDPLSSSRQGTGDKRTKKTGQTTSPDNIPLENKAMEGVHEDATEGAEVGGTAPAVRHPNRPDREKEGGSYNGPDKALGRERTK